MELDACLHLQYTRAAWRCSSREQLSCHGLHSQSGQPALAQALPAQSERFRRQALVELMESALQPAGASSSPKFSLELDFIRPAAQPQSKVHLDTEKLYGCMS